MSYTQSFGIVDTLELNCMIENIESVTQSSVAPLTDGIIVPLIMLIVLSLFKSVVAVEFKEIDIIDFFVDMAIDLLSIFSSYVIGRYFLINNESTVLLKAITILLTMILCVIVLCCLKRWISHLRSRGTYNRKVSFIIVGEYIIDCLCLCVMYILF